ncbi:MAG: HlyD family efflux transporter periplasmic adaptor subunit [Moorea sp. SIO3E2]|nr:HlyD family efflux transporter periplasmic adaptor subunit [Moorena sp. SIO3E2]
MKTVADRTRAKQKFKSGVKWIGWSGMLTIATAGGLLLYNWNQNRPSEPVEVSLLAVEEDYLEEVINESGTMELGGQQTLQSPVDGTVEQILVGVGNSVALGQTLVILRDPERQTALAQQQLEIQKQELKLERNRQKTIEASQKLTVAQKELQALAFQEVEMRKQELQLARNREKVLELTAKLNAAQRELQESEVLLQKGFIPENELQQQKDQILTIKSQLRDAELAVDTTVLELQSLQQQRQSKQRELSNQVLTAEAQLQDAQSQVSTDTHELERLRLERKKIEEEIQKNLVKATLNGTVLEINVKVGEVVKLGDALLTLGNPSQGIVKLQLSPLDAVRVQVNQIARVRVIGPNAKSFTGRVQSVSKLATTSNNNGEKGKSSGQATVTATIKLDRPSKTLIPGSKLDVEIIVAARQNVVVLDTDVIQNSGANAFVWVRDTQGKVQKRSVTLGLEALTKEEVTSGLRPGDVIVLPPTGSSLNPGMPVIPKAEQ